MNYTFDYPSVFLLFALPLKKPLIPPFPQNWQSRCCPSYWFCGLIIKHYWQSTEVWLACDCLALILAEGSWDDRDLNPRFEHSSASELLQCEDSSAWLMIMYYSPLWLCFPFMLKENINMKTLWRLWTPRRVFRIRTASFFFFFSASWGCVKSKRS